MHRAWHASTTENRTVSIIRTTQFPPQSTIREQYGLVYRFQRSSSIFLPRIVWKCRSECPVYSTGRSHLWCSPTPSYLKGASTTSKYIVSHSSMRLWYQGSISAGVTQVVFSQSPLRLHISNPLCTPWNGRDCYSSKIGSRDFSGRTVLSAYARRHIRKSRLSASMLPPGDILWLQTSYAQLLITV